MAMSEKEKNYFKEIKEIEKIYDEFNDMTPLGFPKPKNLNSERKKFFTAIADDRVYNPKIKYEKTGHQVENKADLKKKIESIDLKNDLYGIKKLYKDRLLGRFLQVGYHENWGNQLSAKFALEYWGRPDFFLVNKAKRFCREYKRNKVRFERITSRACGLRLKKEVKELTGNDITVRYVNLASKVNIEPASGLIEINKGEEFTSLDVERLKAHEIGVHYIRYYNGSKTKIKLFETGTQGYLETEEGLAAYNEYDKDVLSRAQMFVYAGRVLATHYAIKKSFYDVFNILKHYGFNDKIAFAITFRAKRNLCDTSLKGGFTKDYVYFKGFYKVKSFAKNNDINKLFIGKISIDDLKVLDKYIKMNYDMIDSPFKGED